MQRIVEEVKDPGKDKLLPFAKTRQLVEMREMAGRVHMSSKNPTLDPRTNELPRDSVGNPWNWMIYLQEMQLPGIASNPDKYRPWWTRFQHLYLHHQVIGIIMWEKRDDQLMPSWLYTRDQVDAFASGVIAQTHPEEARIIREDLLVSFHDLAHPEEWRDDLLR